MVNGQWMRYSLPFSRMSSNALAHRRISIPHGTPQGRDALAYCFSRADATARHVWTTAPSQHPAAAQLKRGRQTVARFAWVCTASVGGTYVLRRRHAHQNSNLIIACARSRRASTLVESATKAVQMPAKFQKALKEGFQGVDECFTTDRHGGDRQKLIGLLKRHRLPEGAHPQLTSSADLTKAQKWTQAFVKEMWREAAQRGMAINSEGAPMRAAAAVVTRSFFADVPERRSADDAPSAPAPDDSTTADASSNYRVVGDWLRTDSASEGKGFEMDDFEDFVSPCWRAQLSDRVVRSDVQRLVRQLGGDDKFGWLRHQASSTPSALYKEALAWKSELPDKVLLVQVGDFFEAWGVDAIMLVQWCGLNPMARKPRSGFPAQATSLQNALDGLTRAGLSAAVYVQTAPAGSSKQKRVLRQIVTPGAPTYLFSNELKGSGVDGSAEFAEGRPYVALRLRADGIFYAELRPFRREVRFLERVTPEGVEALLAENDGVAWPVFVDGPRGSFKRVDQWRWFPKQRKWLGLPADVRDDSFLETCCQTLCRDLRLEEHPPFHRVRLDSRDGLQPLSLTTARNLGVLPRDGVPSLVAHMVPNTAPASTKRVLRRWLLAPRGAEMVSAMREMLQVLQRSETLVLPQFTRVPPIAKLVAFITARSASDRTFRDLRTCCADVLSVLQGKQYVALLKPLSVLVASDTGEQLSNLSKMEEDLEQMLALIDEFIAKEDDPGGDCVGPNVSSDSATQNALDRFLDANESFRGIASQRRPSVEKAYAAVEQARLDLCEELRAVLPQGAKDALVYNSFDGDLCLKVKPTSGSAVGAHDRRGRAKQQRYLTKHLVELMHKYKAATREAETAVQAALEELSRKLSASMSVIRNAVAFAEILIAAHQHASSAIGRGWRLPKVSSDRLFKARVGPYWLDVDAVRSQVRLDDRGAIVTGPNMAGKSTLMRSLGAAALLANCGFLCPAEGQIPRYRQIHFLAIEGDRPAEGVSAFGNEALLAGSLIRKACSNTLALVDEFGRGTEPTAAQAAAGALVEELRGHSSQFVLATHLHGVANLPLQIPGDGLLPAAWRMGVDSNSSTEGAPLRWTYALEEGICRESFAWYTLKQFGWPKASVDRFHRLLAKAGGLSMEAASAPDTENQASAGDHTVALSNDSTIAKQQEANEPVQTEHAAAALMAEVCQCSDASIARLGKQDAPPAAMCVSVPVLYVLRLQNGSFYIGQTDSFQIRLRTHRQRYEKKIDYVLAARAVSTAHARQLESQLQRAFMRRGLQLASHHDAANTNFGLQLDGVGDDASRLDDSPAALGGAGSGNPQGFFPSAEFQTATPTADSMPGVTQILDATGCRSSTDLRGQSSRLRDAALVLLDVANRLDAAAEAAAVTHECVVLLPAGEQRMRKIVLARRDDRMAFAIDAFLNADRLFEHVTLLRRIT